MAVSAGPEAHSAPHTLLVHREDSHRRRHVGGWVRRGLERGEKILYSTVAGDTTVARELRRGGVDVQRAVRDGQLTFVPMERFFPGAEQATLVRRALEEGYPGVRLSAEADAGLDGVGAEQYQLIDGLMDELCASLPVFALCQYDAGAATATAHAARLASAVDSHLAAVQDGEMWLRRRGDQVVVGGEVDLVSADVLSHALRRVCQLERGSEMVIDLTELTFVDVAGCRALVAGTEPLRGAGGRVLFHGVDGQVDKVMALLGITRLPGLELV
jgi:anti-anti-sigma factor